MKKANAWATFMYQDWCQLRIIKPTPDDMMRMFARVIAEVQADALEAAAQKVESVNAVFVSREITAEQIRALKPKQE